LNLPEILSQLGVQQNGDKLELVKPKENETKTEETKPEKK
jgi:hypothetical protein